MQTISSANREIGSSEPNEDDSYLEELLTEGAETTVDESVFDVGLPEWYDGQKIKRAQRYFRQNFAAIYYATVCGLLAAMTVPTILGALMFTVKKPTFKTGAKRYLAALKHTINWYCDELQPGSRSWNSLLRVRTVHSTIIKRANSKDYGIIISQKDLAITQFAFLGYVILTPKKIGAQDATKDLDALCHFWRVLGFLIGIEDRFNVCTGTMEQTVARINRIKQNCVRSALSGRDNDFEQAAEALVGGLWRFNPLLDTGALMFAAGRVAGLPGYHYWARETTSGKLGASDQYNRLNWRSRLVLFVILSMHEFLLKFDLVRVCFNWMLLTSGRCVVAMGTVFRL